MTLTNAKVDHLQNEHELIAREMQAEEAESQITAEKLANDFYLTKETITKAKEKYKSLKTVLTSEEFQIRQKREEIEELQQELARLRTR